MGHTKAQRREKKKRHKMAVHGRGIKTQPSVGVPKAARRGFLIKFAKFAVYFYIFIFLYSYAVSAQAQSEPPPRLFIISPSPGEVILDNKLKVIIDLPKDFNLADPQQYAEHLEGTGHLRLWLDALEENSGDAGILLWETTEYTFENVFSGLHTVKAEFFRNDAKSYAPRISTAVNFETIAGELKPVLNADNNVVDLSDVSAGFFLPRGRGNTTLVIILVFLGVIVLWYIFKRKSKKIL